MNLNFFHRDITGILVVLPKHEVKFEDDVANYNIEISKSMKLKEVMGYNTRRTVVAGTCISDLCLEGLMYLIAGGKLREDSIDALIVVTQSPDYLMPATSYIIQGALELKRDMICMDINQGCAGYIIGLYQAFMLLDQSDIHKVVLINADILSVKTSSKDRNSNPIVGDGVAITIIEKSFSGNIYGNIQVDGTRATALMIPAGGFKIPTTDKTSEIQMDSDGNSRSLDNLIMKGDAVFNFVMSEVPPMIEELLKKADISRGDIDYYMFHQPNRFMLHKLADKLGIPYDKMPSQVTGKYGNASGVSIPTVIADTLGDRLTKETFKICMAGFGVGLTWGAIVMTLSKLNFCKIIDYD